MKHKPRRETITHKWVQNYERSKVRQETEIEIQFVLERFGH